MRKKYKIIIIAVLILVLFRLSIRFIKKYPENDLLQATNSKIQYNSTSGKYYIETEDTIHEAENEDELYIYTIDSEYDPKN